MASPTHVGARRFDAPPPAPPEDDLQGALDEIGRVELPAARADQVKVARDYLTKGRERIRKRHLAGASGRSVVRLHSALMDRLLTAAWAATGHGSDSAVVAVGGYGRSELAPSSDVDLLFLYHGRGGMRADPPTAIAQAAESVLYLMWDTGLDVGHAVRTPRACDEIVQEDHTARTALYDCRLVAGDQSFYGTFEREMLGEIHSRRVDEFVTDKFEEWRARHERFGETVFRLEPNVKAGEGGLRDLHTALWIVRACYHLAGLSAIGRSMLLPPGEVRDVRAARDFLWRTRNSLHYRAGRRQDHLTFDAQEAVAAELGYRDEGHELGIERFMRDYYLSARTILRVSRLLIERCTIERRSLREAREPAREIDGSFRLWAGRLTMGDRDAFDRNPASLIRVFGVAEREGVPIYGYTRDLIREAAREIDTDFREREDVAVEFRALFEREGTRGEFLRPMHATGVLGELVPEFGRQTGLWQHDLYHTYTVDVHSLFAVQRLLQLRSGALEEPIFGPVMRAFENPYPLYLGAWFHDIGKGLGGGHSEKGAAMIPEIARRLRLDTTEAADVGWLVLAHLRMSHVSQRRDLADPDLISSFAQETGSLRRLTMLYLLTFADISTTGEHTWTQWKAILLTELYEKARELLEPGPDGTGRSAWSWERGVAQGRKEILDQLASHPPAEADAFVAALPERYLATVRPERAPAHLAVLGSVRADGAVATRRIQHLAKGYTELIIAAIDRPGLLADVTGVLAAHRVDIVNAQIFSLTDGRVLDVFIVHDPEGGPLRSGPRWDALRGDLTRVGTSPGIGADLVRERLRPSPLGGRPEPPVPVKVRVDNAASATHTVVDVFARDRVGLLHRITRTLHRLGLSVSVAQIATEAHRATDAFYLTDADGAKVTGEAARALEATLAQELNEADF